MNSDSENAKPAVNHHQVIHTTSSPEAREVETLKTTSSRYVAPITPAYTVEEFRDFSESMDEELMIEGDDGDYPVLMATLQNISREPDGGGYSVTFQVPEMNRGEVATLIAAGARVFRVVCVYDRMSMPE